MLIDLPGFLAHIALLGGALHTESPLVDVAVTIRCRFTMSDIFDFIAEDEFRASLRNDLEEVDSAFKSESWKTILVLCGSIVETIMVDCLLQSETILKKKHVKDVLHMSFSDLIDVMTEEKIISTTSRDLASVIKHYRNLIHPGRQYRLKQRASRENATIARSLVYLIAEEIALCIYQNQGLTAEQLVSKLEADPSAANLIKHYAKRMPGSELRKFMTVGAPNRFFEINDEIKLCHSESDMNYLMRVQKALCSSYHSVFRLLGEDDKVIIARKLVQVLNDGSEAFINDYIEYLFEPKFLMYLKDDERDYAEDYIISRIRSGSDDNYVNIMRGLHEHLTDKGFSVFVFAATARYLRTPRETAKVKLRGVIMECLSTDKEQRLNEARRCLQLYARQQKNDGVRKDLLQIIEDADEIPF